MPRNRSELEHAAGQLISAIQKEWVEVLGEPGAEVSEEVMHSSHHLLGAASEGQLKEFLAGRTVEQYLGENWVHDHVIVKLHIKALQDMVDAL